MHYMPRASPICLFAVRRKREGNTNRDHTRQDNLLSSPVSTLQRLSGQVLREPERNVPVRAINGTAFSALIDLPLLRCLPSEAALQCCRDLLVIYRGDDDSVMHFSLCQGGRHP
jgi:hypothetical protein